MLPLLLLAESPCFAALVMFIGAGFGQVVDLWVKLELDVVKATEMGLRGCFVVEAIEREDTVL